MTVARQDGTPAVGLYLKPSSLGMIGVRAIWKEDD